MIRRAWDIPGAAFFGPSPEKALPVKVSRCP